MKNGLRIEDLQEGHFDSIVWVNVNLVDFSIDENEDTALKVIDKKIILVVSVGVRVEKNFIVNVTNEVKGV